MQNNIISDYGLSNFWSQGDFISHLVILILLTMSLLSWTQIITKSWNLRNKNKITKLLENFWHETNFEKAVRHLSKEIGSDNKFVDLAISAAKSSERFDEHKKNEIGKNLQREEFITRNLRQSINRATVKAESGMTILASIGSVSPFVGLFGTVYGIYNALLGISASGSASLNTVSGPVGEALIMTAFGLFVAIPAVLAYNTFIRFNRLELNELDGFAQDLLSYFTTGKK